LLNSVAEVEQIVNAAIGVRCWGDRFSYVVLSGLRDKPIVVVARHVTLPVNEDRPAQLSAFRRDIYDILSEFKIASACFKSPEPIAKTKSLQRAELEGVLQETCFSHVPSVPIIGRTVKQLKSVLEFQGSASDVFALSERAEFAKLAKGKYSEAIVVAISLISG
jgi:hypothetical protein